MVQAKSNTTCPFLTVLLRCLVFGLGEQGEWSPDSEMGESFLRRGWGPQETLPFL